MSAKNLFNKNNIYYQYSNFFIDSDDEKEKIGIPFFDFGFKKYKIYRITPAEEHRPDLLSLKFYGNPNFDWIICLANMIKDPLSELYNGRMIVIPELPQDYFFI